MSSLVFFFFLPNSIWVGCGLEFKQFKYNPIYYNMIVIISVIEIIFISFFIFVNLKININL